MSYLVFARKFRPQTFDEVIGQEPITTTLKNAISKNRIAQSFLFTGSRGVGKTSTARIFAKALNCEKGPATNPCNQCSICQEITQGNSLDILEIDGASNRGVDEIRNLRENVKFKPARARFKIYIIDEVHMLTGEAFNALLKTLEEPPEHVKFIFATTEVHKLPLTILSRCQRFNFRRIPIEDLIKKLAEIAKKEKIKINDKALFLIAKSSEGSLRDGESLLDQLASFGEGEIKESDVTFSLGLTDEDLYFSVLEAIKNKDSKMVLAGVQKVSEEGKDLSQFAKGLLELFRNLLVLKAGDQTDNLIESTEEALKHLKKIKDSFSREELLLALTLIQQLTREVRWSESPRFLIETCLLKLAHRADLRAIDELLNEIKAMEKSGKVFQSTSGANISKSAAPPEAYSKTANFDASKKKEEIRLTSSVVSRSSGSSEIASVASLPRNDVYEGTSKSAVIAMRPKADEACLAGRRAISQSIPGPFSFDDVCRVWPDLIERVKSIKMSSGTYLTEALPVDVIDGFAVFGFPAHLKFHKETLEQQSHKDLIRSTLSTLIGTQVNVSFIIKDGVPSATNNSKPSALNAGPTETQHANNADIINSALNIFEGSKVIHKDQN